MDNLTIYKNKGEVFKCQFKIDGADIKDTTVRLCLEFDNNKNLFFYGKLSESGECEIKIPKLKELEEKEGRLSVEAIADSIYFKLYEANAEFKNSIEISVESLTKGNSSKATDVKLEGLSQEVVEKRKKTKLPQQEKLDRSSQDVAENKSKTPLKSQQEESNPVEETKSEWRPVNWVPKGRAMPKEEVAQEPEEQEDSKSAKSFRDYLKQKNLV
jgi:hypothetical protein